MQVDYTLPLEVEKIKKEKLQQLLTTLPTSDLIWGPIFNVFEDVLEFHREFCPDMIGTTPKIPDHDSAELRIRLVDEEHEEFKEAMRRDDLVGIADAIADLIYVVVGTAITYGIDLPAVWHEVQRSNMAKKGGGRREDGKVIKPAGWTPPDVAGVLENQKPLNETYYVTAN